jgi:hypothetical protein
MHNFLISAKGLLHHASLSIASFLMYLLNNTGPFLLTALRPVTDSKRVSTKELEQEEFLSRLSLSLNN